MVFKFLFAAKLTKNSINQAKTGLKTSKTEAQILHCMIYNPQLHDFSLSILKYRRIFATDFKRHESFTTNV